MEEIKESSGLWLGGILCVAFSAVIWLSLSNSIKEEARLAIEADKIVQVMTDEKHALSCEAIRRIDTGLPIATMNCFGTATCSAAKDDVFLRIFDNISGRQIMKFGPTRHRKYPFYANDASYQNFHDICIAGIRS